MDVAAASSAPPGRDSGRVVWAWRVFRWWVGLVWSTNGLAKLFHVRRIDLGWFRGGLIDLDSAHGILNHAIATTPLVPFAASYRYITGDGWPLFGGLLTAAELLIGVCFLAGLLVRPAAILGMLLIGPIWIMTWSAGTYLWDYPADLVPLLVLVILGPTIRRRRTTRLRLVEQSART